MRRVWRTVAVLFGFRRPDDGPEGIELLVPRFVMQVVLGLAAAAVFTAIAVAVLGWTSSPWLGVAIGVVVFGAIEYFSEVRKAVPKGSVPSLPPDAVITSWRADRGGALKRLVLVTAIIVPVLALLDSMGPGELWLIAPGQPLGVTVALAIGTARVRRWERANGGRLAARVTPNGITGLFAVARG